jgi:hypothetical protein
LLEKKDLRYLSEKYNLTGKRHKSDLVAVELKVSEWNLFNKKNAFLFKKPVEDFEGLQNNNFVLAFMNSDMKYMFTTYGFRYARVVITTEVLLIHADDLAIMDLCFRAGHIRGLNEVRQKGIELKLRVYYAPRSLTIHFRTEQQRARALRRLRHLSGYVTF